MHGVVAKVGQKNFHDFVRDSRNLDAQSSADVADKPDGGVTN